MTALEKAKELVENFSMDNTSTSHRYAKKFALLAVEEILNVYKQLSEDHDIYFPQEIKYCVEVKKEIELL